MSTFAYSSPAPCAVCVHRATHYGAGPCDTHAGDVWAGAR